MISIGEVYGVVRATVPLYAAMMVAYSSVRWWKMFSAEQCGGINKFVAKISIPLLSFSIVSQNNPYEMNGRVIASDVAQKGLAVAGLGVLAGARAEGGLGLLITGLSASVLPNTLILGLPLLQAMYGPAAARLLAQIVTLQSLVWYNLLLLLYEVRGAKEEALGPTRCGAKAGHVARKLVGNPNTHATLLGLAWACVKFRWGVALPEVVAQSVAILGDGGLGMAMFSLGLFMASPTTAIIACGPRITLLSMALKFIAAPLLMAAASLALGLTGTDFRVAVVQAALPQGIVPFVFAKEYNLHPEILSTGVIFGLLVALPVALLYFFLLAL